MWGGRFESAPADAMRFLNDSLPVDIRLWRQDIRGSQAWVHALADADVLTADEATQIAQGLDRVGSKIADGMAEGASDEDIHSLVERMLFEEIGQLAGKLHTGRSRNDQVSTDLRLWCMEAIDGLAQEVATLGSALVAAARNGVDIILPGYTHGQQAQPVRWAFVLLAHAWPLVRDLDRLAETRKRVAILPLGSGALAGSGVAVDRQRIREELGFEAVTGNALDATGDRDFVADVVYAVAMIATHLSRLGAEMVTYSSSEYGYIKLSDQFSTGSSLMPQKRNPDAFELARAKAPRVLGSLTSVLGMMHGLPAGYSKDLQEDKRPLFDAVDTILVTLRAMCGAVSTCETVPSKMTGALQDGLLATDLADLLVENGIPFRDAHGLVGQVVGLAERHEIGMLSIPEEELAKVHVLLPALFSQMGSADWSVERRLAAGSTSKASVMKQLEDLQQQFQL